MQLIVRLQLFFMIFSYFYNFLFLPLVNSGIGAIYDKISVDLLCQ